MTFTAIIYLLLMVLLGLLVSQDHLKKGMRYILSVSLPGCSDLNVQKYQIVSSKAQKGPEGIGHNNFTYDEPNENT